MAGVLFSMRTDFFIFIAIIQRPKKSMNYGESNNTHECMEIIMANVVTWECG